jgi:TnpA family transposase|tara:strand:+ start:946 stop:1332 length:387 start_codon:yes stop_codon:yes gene_type:complete
MVRVVASLRNRTAPANVVVQRLVASRPSDRLAKAFREFGRLTKTIYILRYLHEPELRQRIQLQLNRGEARHSLASLLSNAVLVWNTKNLADIVDRIRASGEDVSDAELAQISPLACKHIIPNGTYSFR